MGVNSMAYARLVFLSGTTVVKKLKEIANIISGAVTSQFQLEFAVQATSTVSVTEPSGWTIVDTPLEPAGNANQFEYRFSAPCVDSNKIKYAALTSYLPIASAINGTVTANRPNTLSTTGSAWVSLGDGVSGGTLTNGVWSTQNITATAATSVNDYARIDLSSNEIYVSVNQYKIFVYGAGVTNAGFSSVLEFPETVTTTLNNNLPVVHFSALYSPSANALSSLDPTLNKINNASTAITTNRILALTNWLSSSDGIRKNRIADDGYSLGVFMSLSPSMTITSTGAAAYPFIPLVDYRTNIAEGIHDLSYLTGLYQTYRSATYVNSGDELTVGTDTYVIVSPGAGTNRRSLVIKKG